MNSYYDRIIDIPNGTWIGYKGMHYDFGYKDNLVLVNCSNFSYISEKIVVLKKENKIYVFSMKIINSGYLELPEKLLEFSTYSTVAYGKIICERCSYLIDCNCQIKYTEKPHIN